MVILLGIPFDANSSFMRGAAQAPALIRSALFSPASNLFCENGIDLGAAGRLSDAGDLDPGKGTQDLAGITQAAESFLSQNKKIVSLGGDHSITFPLIQAYARKYIDLSIIQFDAHPDLYDEFEGNRYSHACPFARIMEEKLVKRLVQIGIRTMNAHQKQQAERFGVEIIEMRELDTCGALRFPGPVYISLDLDVLDPAFAPGVSHREAGGVTTRDLLHYIEEIKVPVVGADVVEYNPDNDANGITASAAAKLVKEITGKMLSE